MSKPMLIAGRTCKTFIDRGLHGEPIFKQNCYDTGSSNSNDPIGLVFIGLGFLIVFTLIFKKLGSNNSGKSTSKLLEDYIIWHQINIDDSASIGNSYATNRFLIIKNRIGNVIDEVEVQTAKSKCYPGKYIIEVHKNSFAILDQYIDFYNKNNEEHADKFNSKIKGDCFELRNFYFQIIKTIEIDSAHDELNKNK
tara:strand:+ start:212 stop:796 length:585 start_codon:yes stop_codon:yes gene_type:complete